MLASLPPRAGIGFKPQHLAALQADATPPGFLEVHAENYLGDGGLPHARLTQLRERFALSIHGVGLSIGGEAAPDPTHLDRIARLVERYEPCAFSEHLAWSSHGGVFFNDLLPLRYDAATLDRACDHVDQVQARLRRPILLENPSTYFEQVGSTLEEPAFLAQIVRRTGCGLLLDVNNVFVSCRNNGWDAMRYLDALPLSAVGEVHLAGHAATQDADGAVVLVDDHGAPVAEAVWTMYAHVVTHTGPVATLIEWDTRVPGYATLRAEAYRAQALLDAVRAQRGARVA